MPITISTQYTKERLLRFNRYVTRSKWPMWVLLAVCTLIFAFCFAFLAALGALDSTMWICFFVLVAIDLLYLFSAVILPPILVKKVKNLDAFVHYTFDADHFLTAAETAFLQENQTVKYSFLRRVVRDGELVYLFISRQNAYIIDLSGLRGEQIALLQGTLASAVGQKKMKWSF